MGPKYEFRHVLEDENCVLGHSTKSKFDALKRACVEDDFISGGYLHMPESVYENQWWNNRNITEDDILKLAIDA